MDEKVERAEAAVQKAVHEYAEDEAAAASDTAPLSEANTVANAIATTMGLAAAGNGAPSPMHEAAQEALGNAMTAKDNALSDRASAASAASTALQLLEEARADAHGQVLDFFHNFKDVDWVPPLGSKLDAEGVTDRTARNKRGYKHLMRKRAEAALQVMVDNAKRDDTPAKLRLRYPAAGDQLAVLFDPSMRPNGLCVGDVVEGKEPAEQQKLAVVAQYTLQAVQVALDGGSDEGLSRATSTSKSGKGAAAAPKRTTAKMELMLDSNDFRATSGKLEALEAIKKGADMSAVTKGVKWNACNLWENPCMAWKLNPDSNSFSTLVNVSAALHTNEITTDSCPMVSCDDDGNELDNGTPFNEEKAMPDGSTRWVIKMEDTAIKTGWLLIRFAYSVPPARSAAKSKAEKEVQAQWNHTMYTLYQRLFPEEQPEEVAPEEDGKKKKKKGGLFGGKKNEYEHGETTIPGGEATIARIYEALAQRRALALQVGRTCEHRVCGARPCACVFMAAAM